MRLVPVFLLSLKATDECLVSGQWWKGVCSSSCCGCRWCNSDCTYWLYPYLRVSQINERSTSVATSPLMSYGILDCRWQPSNNSSISQPLSLSSSSARCSPPPPRKRRPCPSVIRLPLSAFPLALCLSSLRPGSHPCDVWYVSLVKTTPGRHVDIPPCLFISPRRAECCWVVLINDIDRSAHCLTFSERWRQGERERENKREAKTRERGDGGERERETEEKNSLADTFFFFAQPLFPWKPYYIEGDGRVDVQKKEEKTYNRFTGEAVSRLGEGEGRNISVHFSPLSTAKPSSLPHCTLRKSIQVSLAFGTTRQWG